MTLRSRRGVVGDDDAVSYCGSVSGHSFATKEYRNSCTLRKHQVDAIAYKLKGFSGDQLNTKKDDSKSDEEESSKKRFNGCFHYYRFVIVLMGGYAVGSMCLLRYSISIAMVNMVNQTALYMEEHPNRTVEDFLSEGYSLGGEFDWNNEVQQMIMSWYMIAYTFPQLPSTKLGLKIGARLAIPIMLTICSVSTLLTPPAAYLGWRWVLGLRLVQGIGASGILPIQLSLIEGWMPYGELGLGLTCVIIVPAFFTAIGPILIGYLCEIHWAHSFYVPAVFTLLFALAWLILVTDVPDDNWVVSDQELEVICGCQSELNSTTKSCSKHNKQSVIDSKNGQTEGKDTLEEVKNQKNPTKEVEFQASWLYPFKIPSFYAFLLLWSLQASTYVDFIFILPNYLRQFLKIEVSLNGTYCSLIQTGCILATAWPHPFLRVLETKFNMSLTAARRTTHALVCFAVAGTWIYVGITHNYQLLMFFINRCFHSSNEILVTGSIMSNYAKVGISSVAFSIMNTVGNLVCVFSSTFIGYILDETGQSVEAWSWIYIALGISQFVMMFLFCTMVTSNPVAIKRKNQEVV